MTLVYTILIMLLVVGATRLSAQFLPVPLPLIQVVVGALLALPALGLHVALDPELFMLLFIPPLLFSDGWRMPKRELWRLRAPILTLAFGLVFITVLAAGAFIHWLVPGLSWPVAFALAAVLSPTDAVAVSGIARGKLPKRLMHILQGEALFNDASGLVTFRFAVAAAMTGVFSLADASLTFLMVAIGGLFTGAALSWLTGQARNWLVEHGWTDPAPYVVFLLLLPFAAYVIAEHLGFSGILSAVAAGLVQSRIDMLPRQSRTRLLNHSIWSMLEFTFNGLVFLLLGLQLPDIIAAVLKPSEHVYKTLGWLMGEVTLIFLALILLRYLVMNLYWRISRHHEAMPGNDFQRTAIIASIAGVRGAVTLAGVLSLPIVLANGQPFPQRDVLIFIAAGVILLSLLAASIGLPLLLRGLSVGTNEAADRERREIRRNTAEAALRALEAESIDDEDPARAGLKAEIKTQLMAEFREQLDIYQDTEEVQARARTSLFIETQLRLLAIRAQRRELYRMRLSGVIDDEIVAEVLSDLDFSEATLMRSLPVSTAG
ncbi:MULTISPECIES: Na+/H+ antiporter [Pseudomonas]|uniref:Monovalent cation:H+ antiporter, CPA1 family n=1 Tax=Pseudomonas lutea TaxID=243924 RepID=A0A9X8MFM3_9PSED|nr:MULTISPECIES: Na+/H+ antiporter [Pseudomonas]SER11305.1 monovalent cation:H+ antiporter, CPA1 family [Pseudomonas lutea]